MEGRKLTFLFAAIAVLLLVTVTTVDARSPFSDVQHPFHTVRKDYVSCWVGAYCDDSVGAYCCPELYCLYNVLSTGNCIEWPEFTNP
ncbi:periplasmic oligopeptide-binding protein [Corchorus capsularis]|uniref:Periplasmic oligopeptide-binding protein n=1 Tax=Corchorus capsularis TaxID=210143 RepID=A0A1R3J4J3_COCAP|nr:periplasmic oligopeptide-binding protein [Corchorus capsularis]